MYIPKDGHLCWIASVTKLPNFYPTGSILSCMFLGISGEEYFPIQKMKVYQGRDITILPNYNKYKIELQCESMRYDVVGLSDAPNITLGSIFNGHLDRYQFFPVYVHAGSDCLLFVDAINDYFYDTNSASLHDAVTTKIMSTIGTVDKIDQLIDGTLRRYGVIKDDAVKLSNIKRGISIPALAMMTVTGDTSPYSPDITEYFQAIHQLCPPPTPEAIGVFADVRTCSDLKHFINPYNGTQTDIASVATFDESRTDLLREEFLRNDALPLYSEEINIWECDYESFVGRLLTGVFSQDETNFYFTISKSNDYDIAEFCKTINVRGDFTSSFRKLSYRDLWYYLHAAFDLNKRSSSNRFIVTRSWYEDLIVKEPETGRIILYVDLVPWVLAGAEGLINAACFDELSIM